MSDNFKYLWLAFDEVEQCFVNGTTAFLLVGWDSEQVIRDYIDRLDSLHLNRIRVLLDGRTDHFWTEPIKPGNGFRAHFKPLGGQAARRCQRSGL